MFKNQKNGFTLVELLIYLGILSIMSGLFIGILRTSSQIQVHESASNEISNQANFVLQTIQRLIRESSNIESIGSDNTETSTTEVSYLKLRMRDTAVDPTCIVQVGEEIRITEGPQTSFPNDGKCKESSVTDAITTDKISVPANGLTLTELNNYPSHNSVQIDLTLTYNDNTPAAQITRKLTSVISRVSAATFDSAISAGTTGYDIGSQTTPWNTLYVNSIGSSFSQGANYDGGNRGSMPVMIESGDTQTCTTVCGNHTGTCAAAYEFSQITDGTAGELALKSTTCGTDFSGAGICFCQ